MVYQYCLGSDLVDLIIELLGPNRSELLTIRLGEQEDLTITAKERLLGLYGHLYGRYTGLTAKSRIIEIIAANKVNFELLATESNRLADIANPDSYKQITDMNSKDRLKRNIIAQSNQYSEATNFVHNKGRSASSEYSEEYDKETDFDKEDTEAAKNIDSRIKGPTLNIARAEQNGSSQLAFNSVEQQETTPLNLSFTNQVTQQEGEQEDLEESKVYLMDIGMSTNRATSIGKSNSLNISGTDTDGSNLRESKKSTYIMADTIRQQQNFA